MTTVKVKLNLFHTFDVLKLINWYDDSSLFEQAADERHSKAKKCWRQERKTQNIFNFLDIYITAILPQEILLFQIKKVME